MRRGIIKFELVFLFYCCRLLFASSPIPSAGSQNISLEAVLNWQAPVNVTNPVYNVYFGTADTFQILASEGQTQTTFDPYGSPQQVYNWRVDIKGISEGPPSGSYIVSRYSDDDFKIAYESSICSIYVDLSDYAVCQISAECLADDIERVCGTRPAIVHDTTGLSGHVIFVGTLGHSAGVDVLASTGKINVSDVSGQWETFSLEVVNHPVASVECGLVIAGSDRRGTAFGVFDLSQQMGVSPWYWWADVPVDNRNSIIVRNGRVKQGPPSVKYRGIFINDEDWGLQPWAAKTFAPEDGDLGPKTYAKVFELLLRLKANYIWPGMHPCTRAFNYFENNKKVADDYAIVMGSSHCEQMLRNNVDEWYRWQPDKGQRGKWDWCVNSDQITDYWRQRVAENATYENIYTLGMRGVHDSGMPCGGASKREKVQTMQNEVIPAQRKLLTYFVNPDVAKMPQIFCPYKEVLELYDMGMQLPDDITLVWPDDNHGYIRRLSNAAERARGGGGGVYYHISYWGSPHDYLWLCSTSPTLIWEELSKAYAYGADRVWVINVGDIKPAEIGATFAMQMGWDIDRWNAANLDQFLLQWAETIFGETFAEDIAAIMTEYYQLAQARKPEHMGFGTVYPDTPNAEPEFSPVHYGDESQQRIDRYLQIESKAKAILNQLPTASKDAFYQLVYYPVRGASLMNQKFLYAQKSRLYAKQGRVSANEYAKKAETAHKAIIAETAYYNNELSDGKWKEMMAWNPRRLPVFDKPETATVEPVSGASLGVVIEGQSEMAVGEPIGNANRLPAFYAAVERQYFIDIFNKGDVSFKWNASTSAPWVKLSESSGNVDHQQRIWVSVNWEQVPTGKHDATVTIDGPGQAIPIFVHVNKPASLPKEGFVQVNGVVSIEAEHFTAQTNAKLAAWKIVPNLGRSGDAVMILPITAASRQREALSSSPALEYAIALNAMGDVPVMVYCLPTHAITDEHGLRYAVSFDDAVPQIVDFDTKEWSGPWSVNVLRGAAVTTTMHNLKAAGKHTLKIRMVDPGVVIDKIVIGQAAADYLGPPETAIR